MSYGFGVTTDITNAIELQIVLNAKGYDTHVVSNIVDVTAHDGLRLTIVATDHVYILNGFNKHYTYKSVSGVCKGIDKAFDTTRRSKTYE